MIANAQVEIQIVDTHESLETLINVGVAVGTSQFNRTLVVFVADQLCFRGADGDIWFVVNRGSSKGKLGSQQDGR
jgi:hypothetical protein